jgi:hypothetical protein
MQGIRRVQCAFGGRDQLTGFEEMLGRHGNPAVRAFCYVSGEEVENFLGLTLIEWRALRSSRSNRAAGVPVSTPVFRYATQWIEIPASRHYFSQHRPDFSVDDDIRAAVHGGRLAVDNGERGAVRLCDHR